jgi:hypothetical protein
MDEALLGLVDWMSCKQEFQICSLSYASAPNWSILPPLPLLPRTLQGSGGRVPSTTAGTETRGYILPGCAVPASTCTATISYRIGQWRKARQSAFEGR